ncbi:MAG: LysR substrate-binding domain-containing protein [Gammaproteobacteria bacterium]|nr:LysR substrate-binding domain-containing protein [Gammaproteobacteria bacterium]MCW8972583.1 LysR substrate-binding domain-containing protein [Gammaproteobacteria bacterium]MCW8992317.1 LysR substrate-binding domain-containing protein [Gammaproteobacteria bacterium]
MTLTELRYIVAVAEKRHFGRAAQACFVSQPTLSVAVKRLEEELGVTLFERSRAEIALTPAGERVVQQARRALAEAGAVREVAMASKDELAGPLRLGAIYTIAPYLLPDLIPAINEQAPRMPLLVEENYTAVLSEKLKRGDLDVIIIALPFDEPGVVTLALYDEPFVMLLPASHPLSLKPAIAISDLDDETVMLLGEGHCFRDQVLEFCPNCAAKPRQQSSLQQTLEGASLETIRMMVTSGVGLTVLPCTAAAADLYSGRLLAIRRFSNIEPGRTVALAWRKSFPRPKVIEVLRRAVAESALSCIEKRV